MASLVRGHDDEAQPDLFSWLWSISWREQLWLLTLAVPVFPLSMAPFELQRRMINHAIDHAGVDLLLYYGALYLGVVLLQGGLKYVLQVRRERVGERMRRRIVEARVGQARAAGSAHGPVPTSVRPWIANQPPITSTESGARWPGGAAGDHQDDLARTRRLGANKPGASAGSTGGTPRTPG